MSEARRNIKANLRGALAEAKESIEGKRKLNTLDNLISDLRKLQVSDIESCGNKGRNGKQYLEIEI